MTAPCRNEPVGPKSGSGPARVMSRHIQPITIRWARSAMASPRRSEPDGPGKSAADGMDSVESDQRAAPDGEASRKQPERRCWYRNARSRSRPQHAHERGQRENEADCDSTGDQPCSRAITASGADRQPPRRTEAGDDTQEVADKEEQPDTSVQRHKAEQCRGGRAERMLARMRRDAADQDRRSRRWRRGVRVPQGQSSPAPCRRRRMLAAIRAPPPPRRRAPRRRRERASGWVRVRSPPANSAQRSKDRASRTPAT